MMPDNSLSSQNIPSPILGARALGIGLKSDYEDGPIAITDSSKGLYFQTWSGQAYDLGVFVESNTTGRIDILSELNITTMSFTFDQNGRVVVVYTQYGNTHIWWYDTTIAAYTTTTIGNGITSPKVFLDDKRSVFATTSDIILGYIKNSNLYFRQQRDRYEIEYLLATNVIGRLQKIGMGHNLRLQFVVGNY